MSPGRCRWERVSRAGRWGEGGRGGGGPALLGGVGARVGRDLARHPGRLAQGKVPGPGSLGARGCSGVRLRVRHSLGVDDHVRGLARHHVAEAFARLGPHVLVVVPPGELLLQGRAGGLGLGHLGEDGVVLGTLAQVLAQRGEGDDEREEGDEHQDHGAQGHGEPFGATQTQDAAFLRRLRSCFPVGAAGRCRAGCGRGRAAGRGPVGAPGGPALTRAGTRACRCGATWRHGPIIPQGDAARPAWWAASRSRVGHRPRSGAGRSRPTAHRSLLPAVAPRAAPFRVRAPGGGDQVVGTWWRGTGWRGTGWWGTGTGTAVPTVGSTVGTASGVSARGSGLGG